MPRTPTSAAPSDRVLDRCVAGPGACVIWTGARTPKGYGQINVEHRRAAVHRIVYEAFKGAIPDGLEIDHLCRVRNCVNPHHLEAVTHAENNRRSAAAIPQRTHCPLGHELVGQNIFCRKGRRPECRTCRNATKRAWRRRQREMASHG